ncbi:MAG: aminotransferase class III-fold pyridoxal phosphate-dependent enzyme [Rhodospirillales bacterium]|nr:aminotransferase class III-fold pyridoxal phosphate-dependent enzyme [Rhodospirillales bacterium]MBO6788718.1 aminotransferase class III-fold pyridoxal phosphate-dependent enzyme [Rhodospirillales bacterium]
MNELRNMDELEALDRAHFLHASSDVKGHATGTTPTRVIESGKGVYITDRNGKKSLDAFAGLYCVNIGYGRTEVADAISEQAHKLAYYHAYVGHGTEASIRLAAKIIDHAPEHMSRVYFGLSGSDANETNIKLVWYMNNILGRPEKKKIISRDRGYHGSGLMTGSLTGLPLFHMAFDLPFDRVLHTQCPHYWKYAQDGMTELEFSDYCALQLEQMIQDEGPDTVAAFIGEPFMGTGGLIPPPEGYWAAIQKVLDKYDVMLIADEVVTGFGRLGSWFGSEHYGMKPDIITIAKGLTSAYAPLSGSILSERVCEILDKGSEDLGPIGHGWTYSAHPIGAAAGMANLKVIEDDDLIGNVNRTGAYFQKSLRDAFADHPMVGEVRGEGLLAAVEFVQDKATKTFFDPGLKVGAKMSAAALENGVIARAMPHGDILGFAPPFCITEGEVDEIVAAVKKALDSVYAEVKA